MRGEVERLLERGKWASRRAQFPRELGRKSQGGIFCFDLQQCYLLEQAVLYGSVQAVQQHS
jgi:hypothetical protein